MSLEQRLNDLERRVTAMESRGRPVSDVRKVDRAKKWIVGYLQKQKGGVRPNDLARIPPRAAAVNVILDHGRDAGYSEVILRSARLALEDKIEVKHIPGSRAWMWRLL